ncbi:hypothetical protein M8C21_009213, partial [Ambrosia artemisiifolia]
PHSSSERGERKSIVKVKREREKVTWSITRFAPPPPPPSELPPQPIIKILSATQVFDEMILKPKVIASEETSIHQVRLPSPYTTKAKRTNNIYMAIQFPRSKGLKPPHEPTHAIAAAIQGNHTPQREWRIKSDTAGKMVILTFHLMKYL